NARQERARSAAGNVRGLQVPDSLAVGRDVEARTVGAPRRRPRGRAGERDLADLSPFGGKGDEPPASLRVQKRRDVLPVGREPRMTPDPPRIFRGAGDRKHAGLARREVYADEFGDSVAAADADGPEAGRRRIRLDDVGQPRDAAHAPVRQAPGKEVEPQDTIGVRSTAREEDALAIRHPARVSRRETVHGRKTPLRSARPRNLGTVRDLVRITQNFRLALAPPLLRLAFPGRLLERPDREEALSAPRIAPGEQLRAVRADLEGKRPAGEPLPGLSFDEPRGDQPLFLLDSGGGQLRAEPVVKVRGRLPEDGAESRREASAPARSHPRRELLQRSSAL